MPGQRTKSYDNRAEYLAGEPDRLGSVTLDEDLFTRDADGHVHLQPGTVLAKPTESDLWGPYASGAADGRETATNNVLVLHDYATLDDGDVEKDQEVAVLLEGLVNGDKIILEDGSEASAEIKTALQSLICHVTFEVGTQS